MAHRLPQVTVKYIEWLIEQAQSGSQDCFWNQEWVSGLQQVVQQQQKDLRIFFLTVDALHVRYQEKYQSHDQLSRRLTQELSEHDATVQDDEQQNKHDEQLLDFLEQQLDYWRSHAMQRRDKKAKREQQYHQTYFFPVVNAHYQKKYIQARDKNNQVEQQVSDLHHAMDFVKARLKQHRQAMTAGLKYRQALVERQQQLDADMDRLQQLMVDMKQAQSFWCQFDTQHIQPYLALLLLYEDWGSDDVGDTSFFFFSDDRWNQIRQLTMDYEQAHHYGLLQHWHHGTWDVDFMCTQCHGLIYQWPYLDKQTAQLLCISCYQYTQQAERTVKDAIPINNVQPQSQEKQPLSILSTSSSVSIPSLFSSTTKSVHVLLNDCKPFVKKMKSALALNSKLDLLAHHPLLVSRYLYRSLLP